MKLPEIVHEKLTKFPNFTHQINARILHHVCPKNIFRDLMGEGGRNYPLAPRLLRL